MSDNVKVSIKVRPLLKREKDSKQTPQWRIRDNTIVAMDSNGDPFVFDHIFDESVPTRQLFDTVCRPVILSALNGINGTIFAYGQTSSGKTYTMIGNDHDPGVVPLTAREIFEQIKKIKERQFLIRVGFIEIYNEKVHDLLNTENTNLKILENQCGDVSVNSKEFITNCADQIIQHVDNGNKSRKIGETNMNERSSRSHTIFRITIESRVISPSTGDGGLDNEAVQIGILNLVDLAGSERADQTGATGSRFKEGVCINRSLLSLSLVIQKLSENSDKQFINYRDSKLTRILQASLGGNAVTSMICNITPAAVDETYYTLSFAMRAKNIRNKPKVNEILTDAAMMKRLEREIKRLQDKLRSEQNKNSKIKTMELQNAIALRTKQFINSNQAQLGQADSSRRRTWCPTSSELPRMNHGPSEDAMMEARPLMGPPTTTRAYLASMNGMTPQITLRTVSSDEEPYPVSTDRGSIGATLALIENDESNIDYRGLLDHQDLLARRVRSTSPNDQLNPFAFDGDEFVPGEQISFGQPSLSPLSTMARDLHTPKSLRRTRRSSTGDSPAHQDYEQRCRELEQDLIELQEFTKLENSVELDHLKQELAKREASLTELKSILDEKEQRMEQLEERCTHLEIELKGQTATVSKAEQDLALALKERKAAEREAEQHRNQYTGIEFEFERYRQRSEAREKELIESLQEARGSNGSFGNPNSSDSCKLDQKREEMKRLEMQNFEFTLQLEECNKQIEQLKSSCLEHRRKFEQVKQTVLQHHPVPSKADDTTQALVYSLRKLVLTPEAITEDGNDVTQQNGFHPSSDDQDADQTNGFDENITIVDKEKTIQELLAIISQLEEDIRNVEAEKISHQKANEAEMSKLKSVLEKKIADTDPLQEQLKQWKEKFVTQTNEYNELSTQLMDHMEENEVLKKDCETVKQQQADVEAKWKALEQESATLRESLEKATTQRMELERLCNSLREETVLLKLSVEEKSTLVESMSSEKARLSEEYDEMKHRLDKTVESMELMSQNLAKEHETKMDGELNSLKMEYAKQETELKADLSMQRSDKESLTSENVRLVQELTELRTELAKISTQQHLADEEGIQKLKQELEDRVKELELEIESCKEELQTTKVDWERLVAEKESFEKANSDLRSEVERLETTVQQLSEKEELKQNCTDNQTSLAELTELRQTQETLQTRIDELQQQAERHQTDQTALVDQEKNLRNEIESLKKTIEQLTREKEDLATKEVIAHESMLKATDSKEILEKRAQDLEQDIIKYKAEMEASQSEWKALVEKQKEELQAYKSCQQKLEQEVESAKVAIHALEQEKNELLGRCKGDQEGRDLAQQLTQCKEVLEEQLKKKEDELKHITKALEDARNECNTLNVQQKCDREEYELGNRKLEQEVELLKQMVEHLNEEKEVIEKQHSEQTALYEALQGQLKELTSGKEQLTRQIEEREEEILKYITDLDALRTEQFRLVEQQNETRRELDEKKSAHHQEVESLRRNVLQLELEIQTLAKEQFDGEQRNSAEAEELEKLRSCRDESERLVGQLERDLATVRGELEKVRTELLEQKRRHDESEQTEKERNQAMKEETESLRCSIIALEDEKHRLQEADGRLKAQLEAGKIKTAELEARREEMEAKCEELRRENNDLTVAVQELSGKIVNLEEQMDAKDASQEQAIESLTKEMRAQDATVAVLKNQLAEVEEKRHDLEQQHELVKEELREVKSSLKESIALRQRLEADIEESSGVRDVLERELRDLKRDLESLDGKLANERYEQEREVSASLRRELSEKQKELENFMATGRPSLGDGRVVQALRRENEDLLKQLNEARQTDGLKGKQLQERIDELQRLESEISRLRDEMSTMRHESSFNEKEEQITHLQQKVQDAEKVREETVHQKRSLERAFDQLRFRHQSLAKEVDELRRTTDKERKSRRQSTHDDRRGLLFNSKEIATMTDPASSDCACLAMDAQIKELRNKLTLKDCQLNTQKLISSANPLKNEIVELRLKLDEQNRGKAQLEKELREVLEQLDYERKERKRHCTQCIRHSRQQNARCDKAVQAYQPSESPGGPAVSLSIVATTRNGTESESLGGEAPSANLQEEYNQLYKKYQTMKQLCRLRNEKIASLSMSCTEKENANVNNNRMQNECIQLRQQLKEAENYAQMLRQHQMRGISTKKSDVGLQTERDDSRKETEMYRAKYEQYKALAAKLMEEAKAAHGK